MSLDSIQDNYFGCAETPIWIPDDFDMSRLPPYNSCTLRLVSQIAGPGNVSPRADGLLIDENPTVTFAVNGIQHNLKEAILLFGGAHRLPGRQEPCKAELIAYFQNVSEFSKQICLCIPIDIGSGATNNYFATLDKGIVKNRPTFASLVGDSSQFITFRGADLRGRTAAAPQARELCNPVKRILTYFVCLTPARMNMIDHGRLLARSGPKRLGPPKPLSPLVNARLVQLATLVRGIVIESEPPETVHAPRGGIPTSAMKCYRLNEERDIKDGRVYVGGKGKSLAKELADEEEESSIPEVDASIKPGDIQKWLGITIGIIVGVVVCAIIAVKLWGNTFTKYFEVQGLYSVPISAAAISSKMPEVELPTLCPTK